MGACRFLHWSPPDDVIVDMRVVKWYSLVSVRPPIKNQNMHTGKYSFTKKALSECNCNCIIRGFVNIDCERLFSIVDCESSRTRGHNCKVLKEHSNINCRLNSFVCRNINVWNSLPAHVVESDSVAMFKRRLSRTNILCS